MLSFFPTPYPDECLYSIVCRYHMRSGNISVLQTNRDLWDRTLGKTLFLPAGIKYIETQIPRKINFTAERFISENTIFPLLKPFITKDRGETVLNMMEDVTAYGSVLSVAGLSGNKFVKCKYLRHCEQCIEDDIKIYGESYWHRLHQISEVLICPKHGTPIYEADILLSSLRNNFYHDIPVLIKEIKGFSSNITEKLSSFAADVEWLLNNGNKLGYYEETHKIYDNLLKSKDYRYLTGISKCGRLGSALMEFYGQEFLELFDAYNSGSCQWHRRILYSKGNVNHPVYHLLMIRFLAGSAESFFKVGHLKPTEFMWFGEPPYPCMNKICEYYSQGVIERIETVTRSAGEYNAVFICPYCGMIYKRRTSIRKERKNPEQITIADYGRKFKEKLTELVIAGKTTNFISNILHYNFYAILNLEVKYGFLPEERIKKSEAKTKEIISKKIPEEQQRKYCRDKWLELISTNPLARRCDLYSKSGGCYAWLKANDNEWFEENAPRSRRGNGSVDWERRDAEYIELLKITIEKIRDEEKPRRIALTTIMKSSGICTLSKNLASGRLPKTQAFLDENLESAEQWHKRKILWAVKVLREQGRLNLKRLRVIVCITPKEFDPLREFTYDAMHCFDNN